RAAVDARAHELERLHRLAKEQFLDGRAALRRAELAPGAIGRVLVVAPADELRAVPETRALDLVVAHLDHELRPDGRLLELACPPAIRLREAPVGGVLEQRQHALADLRAPAGRDRARADVVEPAVVAVEAEQQRRDRGPIALPADADDDAVGGL